MAGWHLLLGLAATSALEIADVRAKVAESPAFADELRQLLAEVEGGHPGRSLTFAATASTTREARARSDRCAERAAACRTDIADPMEQTACYLRVTGECQEAANEKAAKKRRKKCAKAFNDRQSSHAKTLQFCGPDPATGDPGHGATLGIDVEELYWVLAYQFGVDIPMSLSLCAMLSAASGSSGAGMPFGLG